MAPTEGMSLPSDAIFGPNCGVTAVAIVAGVPFATAWAQLGRGHGKSWKGRTTHAQRIQALKVLGVSFDELEPRRMTLETFVRRFAKPGARYMVRTTGHVQVVQDGMVADQGGVVEAAKHWGRRKFVSRATLIHPSAA